MNNSKGEGGAAEEGEEHGSNEDSDHDEKVSTPHSKCPLPRL